MALEILSSISVDMKHPNAVVVNAVQFDSVDIVRIQLLNNGEKWYVPSGVTSAILYKKSDRIGGYYNKLTSNNAAAISINSSDRSIVDIYLDLQTTTTAGDVNIQVAFFEGEKRLSTFSFLLRVQESPISYADILSKWVFSVLAQANLVVDNTLSIKGAAADAEKTGQGINSKVNKPTSSPNGVAGQVLRTNGNGTTTWATVGQPTDAQTTAAINAWLNAHPEATTTVQNNSITLAKMAPELKPLLNYVEVTS